MMDARQTAIEAAARAAWAWNDALDLPIDQDGEEVMRAVCAAIIAALTSPRETCPTCGGTKVDPDYNEAEAARYYSDRGVYTDECCLDCTNGTVPAHPYLVWADEYEDIGSVGEVLYHEIPESEWDARLAGRVFVRRPQEAR